MTSGVKRRIQRLEEKYPAKFVIPDEHADPNTLSNLQRMYLISTYPDMSEERGKQICARQPLLTEQDAIECGDMIECLSRPALDRLGAGLERVVEGNQATADLIEAEG